jgi:hypothetical protein
MSDLKLPSDDDGGEKKPVSFARLSIWIIVGGIGAYLLLSGIFGVITKG